MDVQVSIRPASATRRDGRARNGGPRQQIWVTEMGWSNQAADPNVIAAGLQTFFSSLGAGARTRYNIGPLLWFDLRDNSTLTTRDDQLGLRLTASDGSDAGPKPVWGVFAAAAGASGTLSLPPALPDPRPVRAAARNRLAQGCHGNGRGPRAQAATASPRNTRGYLGRIPPQPPPVALP